MLPYYEDHEGAPSTSSLNALRGVTLAAPGAYVMGCWLRLGADRLTDLAGLALVALSLECAAVVLLSHRQRFVADDTARLDEREMMVRRRAFERAYFTLAIMVLLGLGGTVMLTAFSEAASVTFWRPTTWAHWNALFFGVGMVAVLLLASVVAWTVKSPPIEEEGAR
ncbi:MAG: hypothetical protein ACFB2Z_04220 [Maricaulaceae bacterium]